MKQAPTILSLLMLCMLAQSCRPLAKAVFGIEEIQEYRPERVEMFQDEAQKLLPCEMLVSDSAQYARMIRLGVADTGMMHHRSQAVQILCFDGDSLIFYHISCFAQTGPLKIDWNHYGSFDRFPPSPTIVADTSKDMTLNRYADIYPTLVPHGKRYTVVVFWTNVLRRVSRQALEALARSVGGHESECRVVLVCSDPFFAGHFRASR